MKIAYISCHDYEKYSVGYPDEESMLLNFLLKKGLDIERAVWNDPTADWNQYNIGILKTPWDYHEYITDFHTWLDTMQSINLRLLNPVETLRWNSDKHYLNDISKAGLTVIPTLFLEQYSQPDLLHVFDYLRVNNIIIKPCVSAGAKKIITLGRENIFNQQAEVYQLLQEESYAAQPFMKEIFDGESSYLFFNGEFSHCILNVPGSGDFRVQHYHGGSTKTAKADPLHIKSTAAYVEQFAKGTLYARVDGLIHDGQFHLMELELIEPYLYLGTNAAACDNYYKALLQLIK